MFNKIRIAITHKILTRRKKQATKFLQHMSSYYRVKAMQAKIDFKNTGEKENEFSRLRDYYQRENVNVVDMKTKVEKFDIDTLMETVRIEEFK